MINEKHEQHLRKDQLRSSLNSHDDNLSPSSDDTTTPENVYAIPDDIPLEFGDGISDVIAELPPLISYNENLVLPHVKKLHLFYQHRQIRKLKIVSI